MDPLHYAVRHVTRFRYSDPVVESVMEVRMRPRDEGPQRCLQFELRTAPRAFVFHTVDDLGNHVHHFDLPDRHTHLTVRAESAVELRPGDPLPEQLDPSVWDMLDALAASDEHWDDLHPSAFARPTEALQALAREVGVRRGPDPLTTVREVSLAVYDAFAYDTASTEVDSPIDQAIALRRGVCQDFAHVTIALLRDLGIPARYVSGYLYHRHGGDDRSPPDASHAWVEALLPPLGWVGFDPTNALEVRDRHIRVAVGRDYADVPPTRGVFKGRAETELAVAVRVTPASAPLPAEAEEEEPVYRPTGDSRAPIADEVQEQPQQ